MCPGNATMPEPTPDQREESCQENARQCTKEGGDRVRPRRAEIRAAACRCLNPRRYEYRRHSGSACRNESSALHPSPAVKASFLLCVVMIRQYRPEVMWANIARVCQ